MITCICGKQFGRRRYFQSHVKKVHKSLDYDKYEAQYERRAKFNMFEKYINYKKWKVVTI